ncbi:MAG: class I SAM-dependent methyltransferase, partial [Bacillota bacterium]
HPTEIEPLMTSYGLETLRLASAEGVISTAEPRLLALPPEIMGKWTEVCYRLGTDPLTWGTSEHMLYVGRKP